MADNQSDDPLIVKTNYLDRVFDQITDNQIDDMVKKARSKIHAREFEKIEMTRAITIAAIEVKKGKT